jgi:hypothetical protein
MLDAIIVLAFYTNTFTVSWRDGADLHFHREQIVGHKERSFVPAKMSHPRAELAIDIMHHHYPYKVCS